MDVDWFKMFMVVDWFNMFINEIRVIQSANLGIIIFLF